MAGEARFEKNGRIGTIILDNPTTRNGLSHVMVDQMTAHIKSAEADPDIRVIVLRGEGDHFCSGADLTDAASMVGLTEDQIYAHIHDHMHAVVEALDTCTKPTLAVIRGACVGIGFSIALACDLRLANKGAKLGLVFARIGLHPDGGSSYLLPRYVGIGKAMEMMLLAETFDGDEAYRLSIVNRAVPDTELDAVAGDWIRRLSLGPPIAYRLVKSNLRAGAGGGTLKETLDREARTQVQCITSQDAMRGVQAFFSKSQPEFVGN